MPSSGALLLCTSCSADKRRDPGELAAIERYRSPRIRALARRADRLGTPLAILSGVYGLLDRATPIPWYDHALADDEVERLAPRVRDRLDELGIERLVFFARPPETPGWRPYHRVLAAACAAAGVELAVEDAVNELVGHRPDLAERLFDLADRDQSTRRRLAVSGELFEGYASEMEAVHRDNAGKLAEILDRHGWPGRPLVGGEGALAAWLVAQHAISLPAFQRRCRALLERAVAAGEAEPSHHARLVDRIRFHERRPQVYGTIFDWDREGRLAPWPIEGAAEVEERRRRVGLPTLADALAEVRRRAAAEGERAPADPERRRREMERWSRAVGWIDGAGC